MQTKILIGFAIIVDDVLGFSQIQECILQVVEDGFDLVAKPGSQMFTCQLCLDYKFSLQLT